MKLFKDIRILIITIKQLENLTMKKIIFLFLFVLSTLNLSAQKVVYADDVDVFHEGFAAFQKDGKWGFIDVDGNVVVEPIYLDSSEPPFFCNGLALVYSKDKEAWGYIDTKGNVAIDFTLYSGTPFYDTISANYIPGLSAVPGSYAHWRIINKKGEIIVNEFPNQNSNTTYFKEGFAQISKDFLGGFVNKKGEVAIKNIYQEVRDFSDGLAAVMLNDKWGFIDTAGNVKVDFYVFY